MFLKWTGGKRRLTKSFAHFLPQEIKCYHEPFVGGGAIFFFLQKEGRIQQGSFISDINPHLINAYIQIRDNVDLVRKRLEKYQEEFSGESYFYDERAKFNTLHIQQGIPSTTPEDAAQFIFLGRAAFNGLVRFNKSGELNPPVGRTSKGALQRVYYPEMLMEAHRYLEGVDIQCIDFEDAVKKASPGDLVYFDSPYEDTYDGYTPQGFGTSSQERLHKCFERLVSSRINVLASNSDHPVIRKRYQSYTIHEVNHRYSANGGGQKPIVELLIEGRARNGQSGLGV